MDSAHSDVIRDVVRNNYAAVAKRDASSCCGNPSTAGGDGPPVSIEMVSLHLGYSAEEIHIVPEGANMGLGCGNPTAIAALKPGETVLDLGSGGGFDCFLAARQVGDGGRVIGVDMTPEMVSKARENARRAGLVHVEFRLGEIEHLPVADATVDVILSNCVINLSPEKAAVFREAYRVLKPAGRLAISDVVASCPLPAEIRGDLSFLSGCIAGASPIADLEGFLADAGFQDIRILPKDESREFLKEWAPGRNIEEYLVAALIEARKPASSSR